MKRNLWKKDSSGGISIKCSQETFPPNNWKKNTSIKISEETIHPKKTEEKSLPMCQKTSLPKNCEEQYLPKELEKICKHFVPKVCREIVYRKISEDKSLPKNLWREISIKETFEETSPPKHIYLNINSYQNKSKESPTKNLKWTILCPKTLCIEISAKHVVRKTSTEQNWGDICTSKSVKRKLHQKCLKRHLYQNISRDISTNTIEKRNL